MPPLFDPILRAKRRDRAARTGPALFLLDRAFEDCLERIAMADRRFEEALLIGCPNPAWAAQLAAVADRIRVVDPGPLFAAAAGAECVGEPQMTLVPGRYELICAIGTLDTIDDLPGVLAGLGLALKPGGLLIGAMSGGDTLPRLRSAMRAADAVSGTASAHVHPRIEASALPALIERAGLAQCVVDVDRVRVSYANFGGLVRDQRAMGASNILQARPRRPLGKLALAAAVADFGEKTVETFEIIHFAAWKPV